MNEKEIREIRRRFKADKTIISTIHGCCINESKRIISTFKESIQTMPQEESERFLGLMKKPLSGSIGRNLIDLEFSARQVMESGEHKLLSLLRSSALNDQDILNTFYRRVADNLNIEGNYLVLLTHDVYAVPYRSNDGDTQQDASDEEFSYIVCSICPLKLAQPALNYKFAENYFSAAANGGIVSAPEVGFMFPAFDNRATNLYAALYYTKNAADNHSRFAKAIFDIEPPMPAAAQKETFSEIMSEALQEECRLDVVQSVHERINGMIAAHKEAKESEPLLISQREIGGVLHQSGVSDERVEAFSTAFDAHFGDGAQLPPSNVVDKKQFVITTPDATIKVNPEASEFIELRTINGSKYILIPADNGVEVNGIALSTGEEGIG